MIRSNAGTFARNAARGLLLSMLASALLVFAPSILCGQASGSACGERGVVATSHPRATEAAIEIMHMGGNAVDAAVAAAFCIGVVEPHASGLGGGGGMVIYLSDKDESHFINYYGCAPGRSKDLGPYDREKFRHTAKSILVPGTVAGLTMALEMFGTLPLEAVIQPAIRAARDGFEIDETLGRIILDSALMLGENENTAEVFLDMGFPRMVGDTLRQPELAATLTEISRRGRAGFYEGHVAENLTENFAAAGGVISLEDLRSYQPELTQPLYGEYRDCVVLSANLPQSGASVIEALNILENVDLRSMGHYSESPATLHLMVEAIRRVHADRYSFIGDPEFGYVPVNGIISKEYAKTRYHQIDQFSVDPPRYRDTQAGNPARYDRADNNRKRTEKDSGGVQFENDDNEYGRSSYETWAEDDFNSFGGSKKKPVDKAEKDKDKGKDEPGKSKTDPDAFLEIWAIDDAHTTHLSVTDAEGNAVSLTQTLGTFFGSVQTVSGVLFNCGMSNFSSTGKVNIIKPLKRPRSSISPTVVLKDGHPFLVVGTPGATRIISTVVELLVNLIDFDMSAAEANNAPRFFTSKYEDYLHIEGGITVPVREKLEKMGHPLQVYNGIDLFFGGAHLIRIDPYLGTACGSADPRRSGTAMRN